MNKRKLSEIDMAKPTVADSKEEDFNPKEIFGSDTINTSPLNNII